MRKRFCLFVFIFLSSSLFAAEPDPISADYYKNLGIPAINQFWSPMDYIKIASVLAPLDQTPTYLPHYSDQTGALYMAHLVNGRNLYEVLRFADSHEQRLELIMLYLDGIQRLIAVYQQVLSSSTPYYAEWLDLIALSSYLAALSDSEWQYYENLSDPNIQAKREAVTVIQTALVNPVISGVQMIPELPAQLSWRLIQNLEYSLPMYAAHLPLNAQQQLYQALQIAFQQSTDPQIRQGIYQLAQPFAVPKAGP
jgi:hypothetical protein